MGLVSTLMVSDVEMGLRHVGKIKSVVVGGGFDDTVLLNGFLILLLNLDSNIFR